MAGATLRLSAAQQIISHSGTRGGLAESLLRELIREFLPQRWAVGTGFIMGNSTDERGNALGIRSNQIDILIYDQHRHAPVFKDGELLVLTPGSVAVAIEVKSSLETNNTPDAFDNICSIKAVDPKVKGFVFGYGGARATTFVDHVSRWARESDKPRGLWPDGVFNMGQRFLVLRDPAGNDDLSKHKFLVVEEKDPVVQLFLTVVLAEANIDVVRAFFLTQHTGDQLASF
jgi:hypothetical protein